MKQRVYTVAELQQELKIGRSLAFRIAKQIGIKIGRRTLIPAARVEELLAGELEVAES